MSTMELYGNRCCVAATVGRSSGCCARPMDSARLHPTILRGLSWQRFATFRQAYVSNISCCLVWCLVQRSHPLSTRFLRFWCASLLYLRTVSLFLPLSNSNTQDSNDWQWLWWWWWVATGINVEVPPSWRAIFGLDEKVTHISVPVYLVGFTADSPALHSVAAIQNHGHGSSMPCISCLVKLDKEKGYRMNGDRPQARRMPRAEKGTHTHTHHIYAMSTCPLSCNLCMLHIILQNWAIALLAYACSHSLTTWT